MQATDLVVVGAGVAGASLAYAASRAGRSVAIVDRDPAAVGAHGSRPSGASGLPMAFLNPQRGRKGAAHPDDLAGMETTRRWDAELRAAGYHTGSTWSSVLRIATDARQARAWRELAAAEPERLAWWTAEQVPDPYRAPHGALRVLDGGSVQSAHWLSALLGAAVARGTRLLAGVAIREVRVPASPGDPLTLRREDGDALQARQVVLCVGALPAPRVVDASGESLPVQAERDLRRLRGEMVTLRGGPALPWPLAGSVYAGQSGERTLIGGGHREAAEDDPQAPQKLRASLAWAVPGLERARIAAVWSGVRARTPDARPVMEAVAPNVDWLGGFSGRGFLTAALHAERWLRERPSDAR